MSKLVKCTPDVCKLCKWCYRSNGRIGYGRGVTISSGQLINISCDYMYITGISRVFKGRTRISPKGYCCKYELDAKRYEEEFKKEHDKIQAKKQRLKRRKNAKM